MARARARFLAVVLFAVLLQIPAFSAPVPEIEVKVLDASGYAVPDAFVTIYYKKNISMQILDGRLEGETNSLGSWRTSTLAIPRSAGPTYVQITVQTPYWISERRSTELPKSSGELPEVSFSVPKKLGTISVMVVKGNEGVGNALVLLERPYSLQRQTDLAGNAIFKAEAGSEIEGRVYVDGKYQRFSGKLGETGATSIEISIPFENATEWDGKVYSLNAEMFDAYGKPIESGTFFISPPFPPIKAMSDQAGFLRLRGMISRAVNLSWDVSGYRYSEEIDLSNPVQEIHQKPLLVISTPQAVALGEGCYRVNVNVTDPRNDSLASVSASQEGGQSIPFIIDQTQQTGTMVSFYRVICVQEDTSFLVSASNKYDNVSLSVQLKKFIEPPPPPAPIMESYNVSSGEKKQVEDKRLEIVVLLLLLLAAFAAAYLALHFRSAASYIWSSITRFMHHYYQGSRKGAKGDMLYKGEGEGNAIGEKLPEAQMGETAQEMFGSAPKLPPPAEKK